MYYDNNLNLRSFRREGMLADEPTPTIDGKQWYDVIVDATSDDPWGYGLQIGACALGGNNWQKCVADIGDKLCEDTADPTVCAAVNIGKTLLSTTTKKGGESSKTQEEEEAEERAKAEAEMRQKLAEMLNEFIKIPCNELSDEQRVKLTAELNNFEKLFKAHNLQSEFNNAIKKLTCDVVAEFRCNDKDDEITTFVPHPECKLTFMQRWGKPLAIGGASGSAVGIVYYNAIKPSIAQSLLAGGITCGAVSYYMKSRNDKKEVEVANG